MSLPIRFRIVGVFLLTLCVAFTAGAADLGAKVSYKKDTPVQFAAFTLTYIGERRVVTPKFPPGMTFYDFRLMSAQGNQTISWTSGTGDIGPTIFKVGSEQFTLELKRSDKLGRLKENELVVSRAP
ncbi:MAG: hypothetical protein ABJF10_19115 [Chthoniobacter sp.]|uniref:hypothetical protein n=1 Tax=Chthoniobacter sp. TaxID=2510640 RepID=UPI0032AE5960